MGSTRLAGYPYPDAGEDPDGPVQIGNLARAVERDVITSFATAGDRDTAITAPVTGMFAWVGGVLMYYASGAWKSYWPPTAQIPKPTWTDLTLAAGWATTSGWPRAGYTKDALGFVHLRGSATNTTAASVVGVAKLICTLPAGYRPPGSSSCVSNSGLGGDVPLRIDMDNAGRIYPHSNIASNQRVDLTPFIFLAA